MNLRAAEEYKGFGDVAAGLRVFVEQLKKKSGSFDEYVQQIDSIEQQVTQFEAVISMLDKYVAVLESKMQSLYQHHPTSWIDKAFPFIALLKLLSVFHILHSVVSNIYMRDTELRPQHVFDCAASILDSFRKLQYDKLWEAELWLSFLMGCWEPPPDGWFKLNVDAAVDGDRGLVGFGAWRRVMVAGVNQASLV